MGEQTSLGFLKAGCEILSCTCNHEFQDRKYGVHKRVHNPWKNGFRCTVCNKERQK